MANRFYCTIHHTTMTESRNGLGGVAIFRCERCVAEARAKVREKIAAFKAETSAGKGSRADLYTPAKTTAWRGRNTTAEQISTG